MNGVAGGATRLKVLVSIGFLPFDSTKVRHAKSPKVIRGGYGWLRVIIADFG